jgi:hypothetical protein
MMLFKLINKLMKKGKGTGSPWTDIIVRKGGGKWNGGERS